MTDIARRIDGPSPKKRAPLARIARQTPARCDAFPFSLAQRRPWFPGRTNPASAVCSVPGTVRVRRALDQGPCAGHLDEGVRRHEVLRSLAPDAMAQLLA